jgi:hypothetical protein
MADQLPPRKNGANPKRLKPMQRKFVEYLLASENFNITEAARKAGYKSPASNANRLIRNPVIKALIGKQIRLRMERNELLADEVLEFLATVLYLDPFELMEEDSDGAWKMKNKDDIPLELRRCVTVMDSTKTIRGNGDVVVHNKIKFMSKDGALDKAMKHLGLINPDGTTNNLIVMPNVIAELVEKAEQQRDVINADYVKRIVDKKAEE